MLKQPYCNQIGEYIDHLLATWLNRLLLLRLPMRNPTPQVTVSSIQVLLTASRSPTVVPGFVTTWMRVPNEVLGFKNKCKTTFSFIKFYPANQPHQISTKKLKMLSMDHFDVNFESITVYIEYWIGFNFNWSSNLQKRCLTLFQLSLISWVI